MLSLAGSPRLTVLGREVRLGAGYADLLAVESSGLWVPENASPAPDLGFLHLD
jgi:hypothetical protein